MNVLLLVVDSLRSAALDDANPDRPRTPFLDRLAAETLQFRRAYASECWTLPSHASMFTGLLPSQHGAHLQSMRYDGAAPTIAQLLAAAGYHTEVVTRNSIFDGTVPGMTRGFAVNTRILAERHRFDPMALMLALSKPRFRRQVRNTGFFHPLQRENREFLAGFARAVLPADGPTLTRVLERMHALRRAGTPFFIFSNLYDVHAPYAPAEESILRPLRSWRDLVENVAAMSAMPHIGCHEYLRPGFHLAEWKRRALLARYHRAIELMDRKLETFHRQAKAAGLLEDTLLIVTSDHGEAFGEHGLYLHDASVHDVHLRVPLWIGHPALRPGSVDDVVSTRGLCDLIRAAALGSPLARTLIDPAYRAEHPAALAEHFFYPHLTTMLARFRQNLAAAIVGRRKIILRGGRIERYDLATDPAEERPQPGTLDDFVAECCADGVREPVLRTALGPLRSLADAPCTSGTDADRLCA